MIMLLQTVSERQQCDNLESSQLNSKLVSDTTDSNWLTCNCSTHIPKMVAFGDVECWYLDML